MRRKPSSGSTRINPQSNEKQDTHDRAPSASGHPARLTARRLDVSHTKLRSHLDHASSRTALLNPISPINLLCGAWHPSAVSSAVRRPPWAMIALPPISVGGRSTSPGSAAGIHSAFPFCRHHDYADSCALAIARLRFLVVRGKYNYCRISEFWKN